MTDQPEPDIFQDQARMLANRVLKRYKHLYKRFARKNIHIFRLYDNDIPEIRAAVDWYAGHAVIAEYTRSRSIRGWLPAMGAAVAQALDIGPEKIHLKERQAGFQDGKRYERFGHSNEKLVMNERDLKFLINLDDFVDTGLFSDHRNTRQMVRDLSGGRDFLNLFCYTGSFTCYAAKGGARSTVSVDRSDTAIQWTRENLAINGIPETDNTLIRAHIQDFLEKAKKKNQSFDLAVVDPPSFSTSKSKGDHFDIVRDHPALLQQVLEIMRPGSAIFFSTNHQNFTPKFKSLTVTRITEITSSTIPEDYASKIKSIHRCWKIIV
ncbi:MAG: class I SAM-dependent methyltransferase [Pseudomonadota bacterium]